MAAETRVLSCGVVAGRPVCGAVAAGPVPWWSFTKTILAAAALVLVRDGTLALDDAVGDKPYTLRHLLQHRAGVPNYTELAAYVPAVAAGEPPWTTPDMLRRVAADQLLFAPGKGWRYSNTG